MKLSRILHFVRNFGRRHNLFALIRPFVKLDSKLRYRYNSTRKHLNTRGKHQQTISHTPKCEDPIPKAAIVQDLADDCLGHSARTQRIQSAKKRRTHLSSNNGRQRHANNKPS